MKKIYIILLLATTISFAQGGLFGKDPIINLENFDKQKVHWGYYLGFNSLDFKFDYLQPTKDVSTQTTTGFNVGLVGNLRIIEHVDLRFEPGLYITQRNITFPGFDDPVDALREAKSTYIHFPLLLKFSAKRAGNIRPYVLGGLSTALNLGSNSDAPDDNYNDRFRMKKWTNFYELGFGIDLYLEYFKFSPSIRGVFSLNDELIRDNDPNSPWTGNIQSMKTRGVFINFTFH
ncbi:PorT protein [Flavobacterium sp. 9AF]|uniref:type IX secretion/gliding motility protein PorT/SprT n=1 Tax=Flavobacterium sp. 9AF TaxID=2653142 RepID=UPI0012EFAC6D|nr:porin family protein [Flavobacterium sp. 9AF]VXC27199.1 PorT protein [Flavobacterium sp. 9AF]